MKQYPSLSCWIRFTHPWRLQVTGEKEKPNICILGTSSREYIIVLVTVSTDGWCRPVFTVYKGAAVQAQWASGKAYHFTLYTSGGLMEELQCYEWITNSFIVHINNVRMKKNLTIQAPLPPVVGHSIHIVTSRRLWWIKYLAYGYPGQLTSCSHWVKWTDLITYGKTAWQQKGMVDCLKLNFPNCMGGLERLSEILKHHQRLRN